MAAEPPYTCPVCRARFRGDTQCSRCGADLLRPMLLILAAQRLRNTARAALRSGDYARAHTLAQAAQDRCPGKSGRNLLLLTQWLNEQVNAKHKGK